MSITQTDKPKQRRGFACMDPEKRRTIAKKGGASVDPGNRSFARNRELARSAGAKGGAASVETRRLQRLATGDE